MKSIDVEQVIQFHHKILLATGGLDGVRNKDLIDSAMSRGFSTYECKDLYKTDIEKIAAITHSLVANHGFMDGNKRIGVAVMLLLLNLNNILIEYTQQELIDLGLGIAAGNLKCEDIVIWLNNHLN